MTSGIYKLFWLYVPVTFIFVQIVLEVLLPSTILAPLHSEGGPHEAVQFVLLVLAFLVAVAALFSPSIRKSPWLMAWVGLAALCCLYVGGEEISWGQHFVQWSTPEYWAALNDQGETNLHNTSSWLDQKPRLILLIGTIVGGLIIPALLRFKPSVLPEKFAVIYPPAQLAVTAFFALAVHIADMADEALKNIVLFERASEVEELYLFYFVLLYLVVLRRRIMQNQR